MSFNINSNQPIIQAAQKSQDGGAGNLGYMKGGGNGNSRHEESANSIFEEQQDTFVKLEDEKPDYSYIDKLILMFKLIFRRIFGRN